MRCHNPFETTQGNGAYLLAACCGRVLVDHFHPVPHTPSCRNFLYALHIAHMPVSNSPLIQHALLEGGVQMDKPLPPCTRAQIRALKPTPS